MCHLNNLNASKFSELIESSYDSLYDERSKQIFKARLELDTDYNLNNFFALLEMSSMFQSRQQAIQDILFIRHLLESKSPIYIYGAGVAGKKWCKLLYENGANIIGFFDKNYEKISDYMAFPIFPPPTCQLDAYIINCVYLFSNEVHSLLKAAGFEEKQIFPHFDATQYILDKQYFDFPDYYTYGIFLDVGCLNCDTSIRFHKWSNKRYLKIIALEPDPKSMENCKIIAKDQSLSIEFVAAGAYSESGTMSFSLDINGTSMITDAGNLLIPVIKLDDIVYGGKVSFLKMDIEGTEYEALQGARNLISRDKPLCAISVYHKPGDVLTIMNFLKSIVPEYKFALRHYSNTDVETVLYALYKNS